MEDQSTARLNRTRLDRLAEFRYQLRKFLSFSETEAERFGIATQQYQLMQVIGALPPGESASISFLAERMILRHNSTVELVDRAERAGLVKRVADPRDLRRSLVVLTPHGENVLARMVASHLEELEGSLGGERIARVAGVADPGRRAASALMGATPVVESSKA